MRLPIHWLPTFLAAHALIGFSGRANAAFIAGLGNPATSVPGGTQITFESNPTATTSGPTTISGVTIVSLDGGTYFINGDLAGQFNNTGNSLQNGSGTQSYRFTFAAPVTAFAFNYGASDVVWTLTAFNSSNTAIEADQLPVLNGNDGNYYGIAAAGISYAVLTNNTAFLDYVFIDNFTSSAGGAPPTPTPLPPTIAFSAFAFVAGVSLRLRAKRRR